jgi:hypothetical protein
MRAKNKSQVTRRRTAANLLCLNVRCTIIEHAGQWVATVECDRMVGYSTQASQRPNSVAYCSHSQPTSAIEAQPSYRYRMYVHASDVPYVPAHIVITVTVGTGSLEGSTATFVRSEMTACIPPIDINLNGTFKMPFPLRKNYTTK